LSVSRRFGPPDYPRSSPNGYGDSRKGRSRWPQVKR
jgi:hypothetical protein